MSCQLKPVLNPKPVRSFQAEAQKEPIEGLNEPTSGLKESIGGSLRAGVGSKRPD